MSESFTTPEGFALPKRLLLPDVRDFAALFEYVREWDPHTMNPISGVTPRYDLVPMPALVDNMQIGPYLSVKLTGGSSRGIAIQPTKITVDALAEPSPTYAAIVNEGTISFELIEHRNNGRVLVTAKNNNSTRSQYLAYIDPATIPPAPAEEQHGNYAIKVDGEEIDHADTRPKANTARDTIIYGGIGTEANTTIEPRTRTGHSTMCPKCGGHADAVVTGERLTATCTDCGWTGTKTQQ